MPEEFAEDRRRGARLIYSLGEFSEDELLERLRRENGDNLAIDPLETVSEYLRGLAELGVLTYNDGRYEVVTQTAHA